MLLLLRAYVWWGLVSGAAGTAQAGHYYSFIKDRQSRRWFRFEDTRVEAWDPANMAQECFGGVKVVRVRTGCVSCAR